MLFFDRIHRRAPRPSGVHFLHKTPALPNLGDELCTPKNYFDFSSNVLALIVGGGAFNGLGRKRARAVNADVRVAWGIGQSWQFGKPERALNARAISRVYDLASTRDPAYAGGDIILMPCVSVLNPLVDLPPGTSQGLFLNHDEIASGKQTEDIQEQFARLGVVTAVNSLPAAEFARRFSRTREITTNSYHVAYWSLLSGRSVRLLGYSTKFLNLLALFDLPADALVRYERGNAVDLAQVISKALDRPAIAVADPRATLQRFRAMNLQFAASLARFGITARPRAASSPPADQPLQCIA
jgi:hypothetical protein